MSTVILQTFGQPLPNTASGGGGSGSIGTPFSITLDTNGESTLDITTLGLSTTTGKQVSGLAAKYVADGTFVTSELFWKTLDATHFYFYSSAQGVQDTLVVTGQITNTP